jgi:SAM-dependent methyltransferase
MIKCPACESDKTKSFLRGDLDPQRAIRRPFHYLRCTECGLRFQSIEGQQKEPEQLYELEDTAPRHKENVKRPLRGDAEVLEEIAKHVTGRRLLDVGSGDGYFLKAAKDAGFDAEGVDVTERIAGKAASYAGVKVHVGYLDELKLPAQSYDVINAEQILTFVLEPRKFFAECRRLLRPGGIVRVREYDVDSLSGRVAGKKHWMYSPIHPQVWTRRALEAAWGAAGLHCERSYPGTEATLISWLASNSRKDLPAQLKTVAEFTARRMTLGPIAVAADWAFHLKA